MHCKSKFSLRKRFWGDGRGSMCVSVCMCVCVCMYVCMINPWHSLHSRSVLCTFLKLLNITICVSLHFTIFSCKPSIILPCIFLCLLCSDFPWIATLTLTGSLTYILEMDPFIHQSHLTVNYLSGTILLL